MTDFRKNGPNPVLATKPRLQTVNGVFFPTATNSATNQPQIYMADVGKYPYREAVLRDRNGDLDKRWYVEFYVFDVVKNELVRKVDYSINTFKNKKQRRQEAKRLIEEINKLLEDGAVINSSEKQRDLPAPKNKSLTSHTPFGVCFEKILEIKKATTRKRTAQTYESYAVVLRQWMSEYDVHNKPVSYINEQDIYDLTDMLTTRVKQQKKISNRTINNYMEFLTGIINEFQRRKIVQDNPVRNWKKLPIVTGRNLAFNTAQKTALLREFEKQGKKQLLIFAKAIYYMLGRPNGLRLAQIKHIRDGEWFFPKENAKGRKDHYAIIPDQLRSELKKLNLEMYPADYYIFGIKGKPSEKPAGVSYYSNMHRKIIKDLGYSDDYTLYSWKHTGVVDSYNAGIDIRRLQLQIGHSQLSDTAIYLKSLGLMTDRGLSARFPDLPV